MNRIAFIGLGNMGFGMAANQVKAGREVFAFDLSAEALTKASALGMHAAPSALEACRNADIAITMLPAGDHVRQAYESALLPAMRSGALVIDCSTIDVETARAVNVEAVSRGLRAADAPVSGGVSAANSGALTFMVGCQEAQFADVEQALQPMAKTIVRAGDSGAGQAAKICNNMLLGISMIGTCEAFALAEALGLEGQKFYEIASKASGQCWSLTSYCPWPGPVATAPSNRNYEAGFAAAMMLKDLRLARDAADSTATDTSLGALAEQIYSELSAAGHGGKDFSFILEILRNKAT